MSEKDWGFGRDLNSILFRQILEGLPVSDTGGLVESISVDSDGAYQDALTLELDHFHNLWSWSYSCHHKTRT